MDVHATAQYDRVNKDGGSDEVTTIYMGEGPPEKYQTVGRIDATDWHTGQPRLEHQRDRLHAHPGGLQRGQHHLAEHLRASHLLLSRRPARCRQRDTEKSDHRSNAAVIVSGLRQVQLAQMLRTCFSTVPSVSHS